MQQLSPQFEYCQNAQQAIPVALFPARLHLPYRIPCRRTRNYSAHILGSEQNFTSGASFLVTLGLMRENTMHRAAKMLTPHKVRLVKSQWHQLSVSECSIPAFNTYTAMHIFANFLCGLESILRLDRKDRPRKRC